MPSTNKPLYASSFELQGLSPVLLHTQNSVTSDFEAMKSTGGILNVSGQKISQSVEFTREANTTVYTAGDVVSAGAAIVVPTMAFTNIARANGVGGYIVGARLSTNQKNITPAFRVHLYSANTAVVAGDNLAHKELYADADKRLGYFDLLAMATASDTTNSNMSRTLDLSSLRFPVVPAADSRTIYAVLETLSSFTPTSGSKFLLTLVMEQD